MNSTKQKEEWKETTEEQEKIDWLSIAVAIGFGLFCFVAGAGLVLYYTLQT